MKKKIEEIVLKNKEIKNTRLAFYEELAIMLSGKRSPYLQGLSLSKAIHNRTIKKKFLWIPFFYKPHLLPENIDDLLEKLMACNNNTWHELLHKLKDDDKLFLKFSELRREKYPASNAQVFM